MLTSTMHDFSEWLQNELNKREWNQSDLARAARQRGYVVVAPQISRILNREQEAGISAVIAIAHGLGLSRETVFRARGWLLPHSSANPLVVQDPIVREIAQTLLDMSEKQRERVGRGFLMILRAKS